MVRLNWRYVKLLVSTLANLLARQGAYARLYAAHYGLSQNGAASTGDNGVPAPALAAQDAPWLTSDGGPDRVDYGRSFHASEPVAPW